MIQDVDQYFADGCGRCARFQTPECSALRFRAGLLKLRDLCFQAGLQEVAKWGQPCYMHAGRNIVIFGAHRTDFRLSFFEAGLMKDPEGVLERQGQFAQNADVMRFTNAEDVTARAQIISSYLHEAMGYAMAGKRAAKVERELEVPDELIEVLAVDPELSEAYDALTPGRQRSYLFNLLSTKSPATRLRRIEKFRPKILASKGATER